MQPAEKKHYHYWLSNLPLSLFNCKGKEHKEILLWCCKTPHSSRLCSWQRSLACPPSLLTSPCLKTSVLLLASCRTAGVCLCQSQMCLACVLPLWVQSLASCLPLPLCIFCSYSSYSSSSGLLWRSQVQKPPRPHPSAIEVHWDEKGKFHSAENNLSINKREKSDCL